MKKKKLKRSRDNRIVAGVIGGIADYFGMDATILRVIFVIMIWTGTSIGIYILLAIIMPEEEKNPRIGRGRMYGSVNDRPRKPVRKVEDDEEDWSDF